MDSQLQEMSGMHRENDALRARLEEMRSQQQQQQQQQEIKEDR